MTAMIGRIPSKIFVKDRSPFARPASELGDNPVTDPSFRRTLPVSERRPGSATPLHRLLRHAAGQESAILLGGLPAIILTTALALGHAPLWPTVLAVLCLAIGVLVLEGALAGMNAGVRGWRLAREAAGAAVLGAILAALLVSLHAH